MRVPFVRLFLSALAAAWVASPAHGQTTLTSGNATFTLNDPPDGENFHRIFERHVPPRGRDHRQPPVRPVDVLPGRRRHPGAAVRELQQLRRRLRSHDRQPDREDTMTYSVTESGASGTRFTATWALQLQDGAVPGEATVLHSVTITNPTASPLTLSLFHYLDFDLNDGTGGHSATGDASEMTITDGSIYGTYSPTTPVSRIPGSGRAGRSTPASSTGPSRAWTTPACRSVPTTGPGPTSGTWWSRPMDRPQSSSRWGSARCPSRGRSSRWPRPGWGSPGWPAAFGRRLAPDPYSAATRCRSARVPS